MSVESARPRADDRGAAMPGFSFAHVGVRTERISTWKPAHFARER
ncbi:MAG: hypothetical protein R3A10_23020 [Caldilineaceae bacterium]